MSGVIKETKLGQGVWSWSSTQSMLKGPSSILLGVETSSVKKNRIGWNAILEPRGYHITTFFLAY